MQVEFRKSTSTSPRAPIGEAKVNFGNVSVKAVVWPGQNGLRVQWPQVKLEKEWTDKKGFVHKYDELVFFTSREDREAATNAVLAAANYSPSQSAPRPSQSAPPPESNAPAEYDLPFDCAD